jgi:hypothetical protein
MLGEGAVFLLLGDSCMMNKLFLGSIAALFAWSGMAHAQVALGTPVNSENHFDSGYGQYAPAVYQGDCQTDCKPKPNHPVLGFVARAMLSPIRAAAGHLMPPRHDDPPTREEVGRMIADGGYSPAEITAAKIKMDEAKASSRRAAVKYLATIDCQYYPEAESGIIAALRADRSENVRYEAAVALANCRGLTERMLEALNMTALGLELDGNPAETSDRVRGAARSSLYRCSSRGLCLPPLGLQSAAVMDWFTPAPLVLQPTAYLVPPSAPITPPVVQVPASAPAAPPVAQLTAPVAQHERDVAETVSATPKQTTSLTGTRTLCQFFFSNKSALDTTRDTQKKVDPRLRGLAPLGSEAMPAIPTTYFEPVPATHLGPYNYQE